MTISADMTSGVGRVPERDSSTPVRKGRNEPAADGTAPKRDAVDVSAEGHALARGAALTPDRIADVRQRILQGAYDQANVVDAVVRRILQSGDL